MPSRINFVLKDQYRVFLIMLLNLSVRWLNFIVDCIYAKEKSYLLLISCSRYYLMCVIKSQI